MTTLYPVPTDEFGRKTFTGYLVRRHGNVFLRGDDGVVYSVRSRIRLGSIKSNEHILIKGVEDGLVIAVTMIDVDWTDEDSGLPHATSDVDVWDDNPNEV